MFPGYMQGLEKIWVIGDIFCDNSFDQHYKNVVESVPVPVPFKNFEVRSFSSNHYDSLFRSPAG